MGTPPKLLMASTMKSRPNALTRRADLLDRIQNARRRFTMDDRHG